jgi:hypothetical protein
MRFESMVTPPDYVIDRRDAIWFVVGQGPAVLVRFEEETLRLPEAAHPREFGIEPDHEHFLGLLDGRPVWVAAVDAGTPEHDELRPESLYTLFSHVDETTWALTASAAGAGSPRFPPRANARAAARPAAS